MGHVYTARFDSRIGLSSRGCGDHGRAVKVHKVLPGGLPAKGHPRSRALARNLVRAGEIAGRGRQAASDTLSTRDKKTPPSRGTFFHGAGLHSQYIVPRKSATIRPGTARVPGIRVQGRGAARLATIPRLDAAFSR